MGFLIFTALVSFCIWIYLSEFHHNFWRTTERLTPSPEPKSWPTVTALIPARNEEDTIKQTIEALDTSDYPGDLRITIISDSSSDNTTHIIQSKIGLAHRDVALIEAPSLQRGWSGKLWALHCGLNSLTPEDTGFILLLDADIIVAKSTVRRLVAKAHAENRALVSLMARLDCHGFWATHLIPAFIYFFQKLYPFPAVNASLNTTAAAAGGCVLIRRDILSNIGGFTSLKRALIDDCTLAKLIKGKPTTQSIWVGLATTEAISIRPNKKLLPIWRMIERTAFTQLNHSWLMLAVTVLGMFITYLSPVIAIAIGVTCGNTQLCLIGLAAYILMIRTYIPTLRLYKIAASKSLFLPVIASLYSIITITSAIKHARGTGGEWKGRTYS